MTTEPKRRRVRKPSLSKLIRATGRTDFIVEQEPDGTTRIIFGKPAEADTGLDQELAAWGSRRAANT